MDFHFSHFYSLTPRQRGILKDHIDFCSSHGRTYEFHPCRMPAGCLPKEACVGFWRKENSYLLYLKPAVTYQGNDRKLERFLKDSPFHWFSSFEALTDSLRLLGGAPAPQAAMPPLFHRLHDTLRSFVLGQEQAVEAAAFKVYGHICKREPLRPLSLILYGPTCVGKSELAKSLAPALNGCLDCETRYQTVWTELNTFTEAHSVYRLTGAPPGYAGYEDQPVFEAVRHNPYTVFLFDELDKAHPEVLKVFMSILDEGRCSAHRAAPSGERELDFRRCIFVFTTNANLSTVGEKKLGFAPPREQTLPVQALQADGPAGTARRLFQADEIARRALTHHGVLQEIAGRFSGLIGFQPLSQEARQAITAKQVTALGREYGLLIQQVSPELVRALTPDDALSLRSTVSVLEGVLTPLFLAQAEQAPAGSATAFQLTGTPDDMRLTPISARESELPLPVF